MREISSKDAFSPNKTRLQLIFELSMQEGVDISQILAACGDGKLSELSQTSSNFRDHISKISLARLSSYVNDLINTARKDGGLILQDIVNNLGSRLGFDVEFGRYRGAAGENGDLENCLKVAKILPSLTEIEATDERIWTTLSFGRFKNYALARWPFTDSTHRHKHVLNHWFASNVRGRMRNNAIARLWWYQRLCQRVPGVKLEDTLKLLFFNSDYRSSMLERNTSSAITSVVACIMQITEENKKKVCYTTEKNSEIL